MTCKAILRRASVNPICVTGLAGNTIMLTGQREGSAAMIEGHVPPTAGDMAPLASCPKLAAVRFILPVAGETIHRGSPVTTRVTSLARNGRVHSGQLKSSQAMVEGPILPIAGIMAGNAIRPKATFVRVILLVAGKAVYGRSYEERIHVALAAGYSYVCSHQLKARAIVVEVGWLPARGQVARGAIRTQFPRMRIVHLMTRRAGLWSKFQVGDFARTQMAL